MAAEALCGTTAATSVQRSVWTQSVSREWWDRDVSSFSETDFTQSYRMTRATLNHNKVALNSNIGRKAVQTEVTLHKTRFVSD